MSVAAEVRLETRPDGSVVVYNVGPKNPASGRAATETSVNSEGAKRRNAVANHRERWSPFIEEQSRLHGLDPKLVKALIRVESSFDPRAKSKKGAMGLMQLMPATARDLGVTDAFDPQQNVRGGVTYLRRMIDRFGRMELALAAYNAGPEAVARYGGIPPYRETRQYVDRVLSVYLGRPVEVGPLKIAAKPRLVRDRSGRMVMTNQPPG